MMQKSKIYKYGFRFREAGFPNAFELSPDTQEATIVRVELYGGKLPYDVLLYRKNGFPEPISLILKDINPDNLGNRFPRTLSCCCREHLDYIQMVTCCEREELLQLRELERIFDEHLRSYRSY